MHSFPEFQDNIPNGHAVVHPCTKQSWMGVGHQSQYGSGTLNPFGEAFKATDYVSCTSSSSKIAEKSLGILGLNSKTGILLLQFSGMAVKILCIIAANLISEFCVV